MNPSETPETLTASGMISPLPIALDSGERSRLLTLVFTDLFDSVGLKTRLGDTEAGRLISLHIQEINRLAAETGGRQILVAGDGCFLTFETPSRAVEFALRLQDFHRQNPGLPRVRVGIHMGEVTETTGSTTRGSTVELQGLAVDIASRIQGLAHPGQTLMSYAVFDNARQRLDGSSLALPVEWRAHGRYIFCGSDLALEIFEVGLKGIADFAPPPGSNKAKRDVTSDDEDTLGWRPAQGLELPGRPNRVLVEKLGEGGFGDVWLSEHRKTRDQHVIKFCYSTDRLRTLKREVTLFRLLKETLGDRPDIARVIDYQFDTSPYFLEMEYAGKYNLTAWMQEKGGVNNIPLETRLEIVAQVADAIAAAHSVGVLHKDIKPSNIMVSEKTGQDHPQVRMIDFGIGAVADRHLLDLKGITATGLTETDSSPEYRSSLTGTRLYMAPELIEGKPATIKSDIYSLGVLLYQMVSGHIGQALSFGWERDIPDEILREDIQACVDGRPENRLVSAEDLARRIRDLPQRQAEREAERVRGAQKARASRRRRYFYVAAGLLFVLVIFIGQYARMQFLRATTEEKLRMQAEAASREAKQQTLQTVDALKAARQAQYFGAIALAEAGLRESRFEKVQDVLLNEAPKDYIQREWGWLLAQTAPEDFAIKGSNIFDAVFNPAGNRIIIGDRDSTGNGRVQVYDAQRVESLSQFQTNVRLVWNIALSPDGKYIATASSDNIVTVVDLETSAVAHQLTANSGIIRDVAFSPDGKLLASCSRDKYIRLWNTDGFDLVKEIHVPEDSFTEISFSPDSRYLASASLETNVRAFDVQSGLQVISLAGHEDRVLSVAFLKDGSGVVSACKDGVTRVFDWPQTVINDVLLPVVEMDSRNSYPAQVVSSPDGKSIYIGNDNGLVEKVDSRTGVQLETIQVDQPLWKMSICREGKRLLTTSRWSLRMLDLERLEAAAEVSDWNVKTAVPETGFDIKTATVVNLRDQTWMADNAWRTTTGLSLVTAPQGKQFLVESAYDIYSPDYTQHIKIDPATLSAHVTDTGTSTVLWTSSKTKISAATFSPDGQQATLLMEDVGGQVFNTSDWTLKHTVGKGNVTPVSLAYSPDGKQLVVCFLDGLIESYDTRDGALIKKLYDHRAGAALSLDISEDNKLLAAGLDVDRAMVIDLNTGDHISTMTGHVRYVHRVKFVPNSTRLATLSRDGTVKLWDINTGRELVTLFHLENGAVPLGILFEPNGRHIHVAASDRRVISTDVFPWNLEAYGKGDESLEEKVELWKRRQRLQKAVATEDSSM